MQQWRDAAILSENCVGKGRSKGKRAAMLCERSRQCEHSVGVYGSGEMLVDVGPGLGNNDQERTPWPLEATRMVSIVSGRIKHDLSGKACFAKWRSTPQQEVRKVAYLDAVFIGRESRLEIYLGIPHQILKLTAASARSNH